MNSLRAKVVPVSCKHPLRCHYGDGKENVKNRLVKISKKTTLHVHHAFLYISLPSLHDYDVNCLISRFIDNLNIRRRISPTLFKLGYFLKNSTLGDFAYIKHSDLFDGCSPFFGRHGRRSLMSSLGELATVVLNCELA